MYPLIGALEIHCFWNANVNQLFHKKLTIVFSYLQPLEISFSSQLSSGQAEYTSEIPCII